MTHKTTCKFCRTPIALSVDDAYSRLGDPHKLFPAACCNPCGDLRTRRRALEGAIAQQALMLIQAGRRVSDALETTCRDSLIALTKKYSTLVSDWQHTPNVWDPAIVDFIIGHPSRWGDALQRCWRMQEPTPVLGSCPTD